MEDQKVKNFIDYSNKPIQIEKSRSVAIVRVENYNPENVKSGLERIIELLSPSFFNESLNKKSVLLKPNVLAPDKMAFTNEVVVEQLAEILKMKGVRDIFIGDSTMTKEITKIAHNKSGLADIALKFEHKMINFLEDEFFTISHNSFEVCKVIRIPKTIYDVDIIINLPKMKTHAGYVYTGAIKNFFGLVEDKISMHRIYKKKSLFQKMLGDIHQAVLCCGKGNSTKPVLHIMDSIKAMEGKGPRSGKHKEYNCLIGSFSPVALDALAYTLMGGHPEDLIAIKSLSKRNSWEIKLNNLNIIGDNWKDFKDVAQLPPLETLNSTRTGGSLLERLAVPILRSFHPIIKIKSEKCKLCMKCVSHCPMQALYLDDRKKKIRVDRTKCINCFCCGEICSNNAVKQRRPISKVLPLIS